MTTPSNVEIICRTDDLGNRYRKGYPITCPLRFEIGTFAFPNSIWDDFAVPILTEWVKQLGPRLLKESKQIELGFMGGDYVVHIKASSNGRARLEFLKESTTGIEKLGHTNIRYSELKNMVFKVARNLVSALEENGIADRDYFALVAALKDSCSGVGIE